MALEINNQYDFFRNVLLDDDGSIIVTVSGGTTTGTLFSFTAINFNDLNTQSGATSGDLAYVFNSQGVQWLPGTIGGTFYPQGIYVFSSSTWTSDRNSIALQFDMDETLIEGKVDKSGDTMTGGLIAPSLSATTLDLGNPLTIENGGTSAELAVDARHNLGLQSTALYSGGTISGIGTSALTISAGMGYIVDNSGIEPSFTAVTWDEITGITKDFDNASEIGIDVNGNVVQDTTDIIDSASERRNLIHLGTFVFAGPTVIIIVNAPFTAQQPSARLDDLSMAIGGLNVFGNVMSPVGSTLAVQKSVGTTYRTTSNFETNKAIPDIVENDPTVLLSGFTDTLYTLISGGTTTVRLPYTGFIDPENYDVAGTLTSVPNNRWTIQRIWLFNANNSFLVTYGQAFYFNQDAAILGVSTEPTIAPVETVNAVLLASIVVAKGATDLSDTGQATFVQAGKFGTGGGGGGAISITDLQTAYNNSTQPEIMTDVTRGSVDFRQGSGSDTDNVFTIQNNAGTINTSIKGNGLLTTQSLSVIGNTVLDGNLTVLGTETIFNTETLEIEDHLITLNSTFTAGTPTLNSGIESLRGSGTTAQFIWNETNDQWEAGFSGSTSKIMLESDGVVTKTGTPVSGEIAVWTGDGIIEGTSGLTNSLFFGIGVLTVKAPTPIIVATSTVDAGASSIKVGFGRVGEGDAIFDLVGDQTYTEYGLRMIRNSGVNGDSEILHRGTGDLRIITEEFSDVVISNNLVVNAQVYSQLPPTLTPTGTTQTVDWSDGNGAVVDLESATGDVTLTLTNGKAGASYIIKFIQGATFRDVVLPSSVLTPGGSAPTTLDITETNNAIDTLTLFYDGTNYIAQLGQNYG